MNENASRNDKGQFVKGSGVVDLAGQRYGRLVVLSKSENPKQNRKTYWLCQCDCGNTKVVRSDCLGKTTSCGCLKSEQDIANLGITYNHNTTHHKLFHIWNAVMNRCHNHNNKQYADYGGRGIVVCQEWHDPVKFLAWADATYVEGYTIERIDVNKGYNPQNCTWIPMGKQACNTRRSVYIVINGEKDNITHWMKRLHISHRRLKRLYKDQLVYNV